MKETKSLHSPRKLADEFAKYFTEKSAKTRDSFKNDPESKAIELTKFLMQKPKTEFKLKTIMAKEAYRILNDTENSQTVSDKNLCIKFLAQIPFDMAQMVSHIYNHFVRTRILPECLKMACLIPLKKHGKQANLMKLCRTFSLLNIFRKLIEEISKKQIVEYFKGNRIIPEGNY